MTGTRILIGQLLICLMAVVVMLQLATQWTANELAGVIPLGEPWVYFGDQPVFYPWAIFLWWLQFEAVAPMVFFKGAGIAASGGFLAGLTAVTGSVLRARQPKVVTTYGSAHWASDRDVKKAGLLKDRGVFLGQRDGKYLRHDGPEHVMAFAPTRSGKGVSLVIPTLLSWTGSAIIHDIKGENWQRTAAFRQKFSRVFCFDPTNKLGAKFNPLAEIRKGDNEIRDVQNIIDIMIDPQGSREVLDHWDKTANDLMIAVILHVLYAEPDKTMKGLGDFLSDPARSKDDTLHILMSTPHLGDQPHPVVARGARAAKNMAEKEYSAVLSTAMTLLSLYKDPVVNQVTASSDFTIDELVHGEEPISLYLVVPPSDLSRTRPLIRLTLSQMLRRLTEELDVENGDTSKLLLMLDEFPALGRLDFFETALAYIAGYGIRAFLICQSLNQLDKAYGPNNAILDNCHVKVTFAANNEQTAERISKFLGVRTEQRTQRNFAGHRLDPWLSNLMVSSQETSRPLMTADEILRLPKDDLLIFMASTPPIRAKKITYYQDRNFMRRSLSSKGVPLSEPTRLARAQAEAMAERPVILPPDAPVSGTSNLNSSDLGGSLG